MELRFLKKLLQMPMEKSKLKELKLIKTKMVLK